MGDDVRRLTRAATLLPLLAAPLSAQTGPTGADLALSGTGGLLRAAGYEIQADEVRLLEAGGVLLSGATLSRPGRDGYVMIRQLEAPDIALLAQALSPTGACDPTDAGSGRITAREVRFRPDSDLGVPEGREEIRIPALIVDLSQVGCSLRISVAADAVVVSGVDGSRIDLSSLEARVRISGTEMREVEARVDLFGIGLSGPAGPGGFRADEAGFSFTADLSDGALLSLARSGSPLPDLIGEAAESVLRGGFYLRGVELVPDLFLPERDRTRTGLDGGGAISGQLELAASLQMGEIRIRGASDLSGVLRGEIDLVGSLPPPGGVAIPAGLSSSLPVPPELIGVSVERASFRYEDLGAGRVLEALSGQGAGALAERLLGDRVERIAGRLPGGLPATVRAAWDAVLAPLRSGKGAAGVRPDRPFSLLELAVSGMMGPGSAASRTGAWQEE